MRVPSGVEYLQAYPSRLGGGIGTAAAAAVVTPPPRPRVRGDAYGVDRVGDDLVPIALLLGGELPGEGSDPAASVRRDATGDFFFRGGCDIYIIRRVATGGGGGAGRSGAEHVSSGRSVGQIESGRKIANRGERGGGGGGRGGALRFSGANVSTSVKTKSKKKTKERADQDNSSIAHHK